MAKTHKTTGNIARRPIRGRILVLLACLLLLYVVIPQFGSFAESFGLLRQVAWLPVTGAALLVIVTYLIAAGIYCLLAARPLRFGRTLLIQAASAFANRILPAGLGGLTLNVQYLRNQRHSLPQAVAVAGTNNTLGFLGHLLILLMVVASMGSSVIAGARLPHVSTLAWAGVALGLVLGGSFLLSKRIRRAAGQLFGGVGGQLLVYRRRPYRMLAALACSMLLTVLYVTVFYAAGRAVGATLMPAEALMIFSAGILVGTAVPTPGGLGGVEAGLVAGSVAYGQDASVALAAALLYRLLTYWIPLAPGFACFVLSRKYYI